LIVEFHPGGTMGTKQNRLAIYDQRWNILHRWLQSAQDPSGSAVPESNNNLSVILGRIEQLQAKDLSNEEAADQWLFLDDISCVPHLPPGVDRHLRVLGSGPEEKLRERIKRKLRSDSRRRVLRLMSLRILAVLHGRIVWKRLHQLTQELSQRITTLQTAKETRDRAELEELQELEADLGAALGNIANRYINTIKQHTHAADNPSCEGVRDADQTALDEENKEPAEKLPGFDNVAADLRQLRELPGKILSSETRREVGELLRLHDEEALIHRAEVALRENRLDDADELLAEVQSKFEESIRISLLKRRLAACRPLEPGLRVVRQAVLAAEPMGTISAAEKLLQDYDPHLDLRPARAIEGIVATVMPATAETKYVPPLGVSARQLTTHFRLSRRLRADHAPMVATLRLDNLLVGAENCLARGILSSWEKDLLPEEDQDFRRLFEKHTGEERLEVLECDPRHPIKDHLELLRTCALITEHQGALDWRAFRSTTRGGIEFRIPSIDDLQRAMEAEQPTQAIKQVLRVVRRLLQSEGDQVRIRELVAKGELDAADEEAVRLYEVDPKAAADLQWEIVEQRISGMVIQQQFVDARKLADDNGRQDWISRLRILERLLALTSGTEVEDLERSLRDADQLSGLPGDILQAFRPELVSLASLFESAIVRRFQEEVRRGRVAEVQAIAAILKKPGIKHLFALAEQEVGPLAEELHVLSPLAGVWQEIRQGSLTEARRQLDEFGVQAGMDNKDKEWRRANQELLIRELRIRYDPQLSRRILGTLENEAVQRVRRIGYRIVCFAVRRGDISLGHQATKHSVYDLLTPNLRRYVDVLDALHREDFASVLNEARCLRAILPPLLVQLQEAGEKFKLAALDAAFGEHLHELFSPFNETLHQAHKALCVRVGAFLSAPETIPSGFAEANERAGALLKENRELGELLESLGGVLPLCTQDAEEFLQTREDIQEALELIEDATSRLLRFERENDHRDLGALLKELRNKGPAVRFAPYHGLRRSIEALHGRRVNLAKPLQAALRAKQASKYRFAWLKAQKEIGRQGYDMERDRYGLRFDLEVDSLSAFYARGARAVEQLRQVDELEHLLSSSPQVHAHQLERFLKAPEKHASKGEKLWELLEPFKHFFIEPLAQPQMLVVAASWAALKQGKAEHWELVHESLKLAIKSQDEKG